ncbi:MAG: M23 family metallopeptidase [bacterium]|nr:M23 family metallopeptidase [bacterium]
MAIVFLIALTTIFGNSFSLFASSESPYKLPYPAGKEYRVTQGNDTKSWENRTHYGIAKYAFDFDGKFDGNPVVDSRSGKVLSIQDKFGKGKCGPEVQNEVNYVLIDHGDGTSALYLHLQKGSIIVKEDEDVRQGQVIGKADSSGYVCGAHLHFQVQVTPKKIYYNSFKGYNRGWYTQSIQISFSDKDVLAKEPDGIPRERKSYISDNYLPTPTPTPTPTVTATMTPTATPIPSLTPTKTPTKTLMPASVELCKEGVDLIRVDKDAVFFNQEGLQEIIDIDGDGVLEQLTAKLEEDGEKLILQFGIWTLNPATKKYELVGKDSPQGRTFPNPTKVTKERMITALPFLTASIRYGDLTGDRNKEAIFCATWPGAHDFMTDVVILSYKNGSARTILRKMFLNTVVKFDGTQLVVAEGFRIRDCFSTITSYFRYNGSQFILIDRKEYNKRIEGWQGTPEPQC